MVGTSDQDHLSAFTSEVQKDVGNKVVSRRRARAVNTSSAHVVTSALSPRMWDINSSRKLMVWRLTHDWENRTKIEIIRRKIKTSAVTYITQVYLHPRCWQQQLASQQTTANRPFYNILYPNYTFEYFYNWFIYSKTSPCSVNYGTALQLGDVWELHLESLRPRWHSDSIHPFPEGVYWLRSLKSNQTCFYIYFQNQSAWKRSSFVMVQPLKCWSD